MPVHSAVAAANAINAANGPFPTPAGNASTGGGGRKKDVTNLDEALSAAESDLPEARLAELGAAEARPATPDFVELGAPQLPEIRPEETHEHGRGHFPHHGEDEAEEKKRRKRDLYALSTVTLAGGAGLAAGITQLCLRR